MSRVSSLPRPPSTGGLSSRGASGEIADSSSVRGNQKDRISVAVRVRPIKYVNTRLSLSETPTLVVHGFCFSSSQVMLVQSLVS